MHSGACEAAAALADDAHCLLELVPLTSTHGVEERVVMLDEMEQVSGSPRKARLEAGPTSAGISAGEQGRFASTTAKVGLASVAELAAEHPKSGFL